MTLFKMNRADRAEEEGKEGFRKAQVPGKQPFRCSFRPRLACCTLRIWHCRGRQSLRVSRGLCCIFELETSPQPKVPLPESEEDSDSEEELQPTRKSGKVRGSHAASHS